MAVHHWSPQPGSAREWRRKDGYTPLRRWTQHLPYLWRRQASEHQPKWRYSDDERRSAAETPAVRTRFPHPWTVATRGATFQLLPRISMARAHPVLQCSNAFGYAGLYKIAEQTLRRNHRWFGKRSRIFA